ncbi:MAG: exo-alpha-sialidase [Gemmatimonadetes bacterium]|nr:exo-alpha-sialidase [Gemmatimonadota bacterium]MBT4608776.1 exo-alpha-sialidase [Gemmatimonadota bacterium]MBT5057356.1 exo-alpha-sialidase [Gemmatimonadota bacterium]MBT5145894.1 exo-alpha-sialidase [Gemmatimonadota bacterium]MBT5589970.1 exo-alpha-sialidase [Gemmatimonadota bacterium]
MTTPEIVSLTRIWDHAPHNAFTDLTRFGAGWLCTFREAKGHEHCLATIRVLQSDDGLRWHSVAEIGEEGVDLRDPKLSIMPDGRVMLLTSANFYADDGRYITRSPRVCFSDDGLHFTPPARCLAEDHWLWRATWHEGVAYSVSKLGVGNNPRRGFLYATRDGLDWHFITEFILPNDTWTASETTVRIMPDGEMIALIRPDWIGSSYPPYEDWSFTQIEASLGGPNFVRAPDGYLWASARGRGADGKAATILARMTRNSYEPTLILPSGGDCSYPGMVWHDGLLWMSYYSSHEGKSSIYLATIRLPAS